MADRTDDRYERRKSGLMLPLILGLLLVAVVGGLGWGISSGMISLSGDLLAPRNAAVAEAAGTPAAATPAAATEAPAETAAATAAAAPAPVATREEAFEDWRLTCVAGEAGADVCTLMQRLADSASGNPLFIWRISQNGQGGLVGVWQTPEIVLLTRGVYLDVGTPEPLLIPYERCGGGSCLAVATLAPDLVQTITAAEKITVGYVLTDGRQMTFPMSPKGLAAGLAELAK